MAKRFFARRLADKLSSKLAEIAIGRNQLQIADLKARQAPISL